MSHSAMVQGQPESSDEDHPALPRRQPRAFLDEQEVPISTRSGLFDRQTSSPPLDSVNDGLPESKFVTSTKRTKKPGNGGKLITKNDLAAKLAVIQEIESYWGKDFIRSYIPKVHRPLVKYKSISRRPSVRAHEADPRSWLPSILKCILMIAKLTNDKKWLKEAMEKVVRHRIKHTGNRKPQLVTTDFSILEDMLVKHWDVEYSFEIRYKHLAVTRKDNEETDENIDHILHPDENAESDIEDAYAVLSNTNTSENSRAVQESARRHDRYIDSNQRNNDSYVPTIEDSRQKAKKIKASQASDIRADIFARQDRVQARVSSHGYFPSFDLLENPWERSVPPYIHNNAYGKGIGGFASQYGTYGGYGTGFHSSSDMDMSAPSRSTNYHEEFGLRSTPPQQHLTNHRYPSSTGIQDHSNIKRESPAHDEVEIPPNQGHAEFEEDEDLDGEIEAVELELKLARLRARRAARKSAR